MSFKMTREMFEQPTLRLHMLRNVLRSYSVAPPEDVELQPTSDALSEYTACDEYQAT